MKRIISFLVCFILLSSLMTAAYAAGGSELQVLDCRQNDTVLDILLFAKADTVISPSDVSVRIEDTKLAVDKLSLFSETDYGTSWIVVVEPSAYDKIANTVSAVVESLINNLGPEDNLAVLDAANREMTTFVRDMPTIRGFVKTAASPSSYSGYVRLHDAVKAAFSAFDSNEAARMRKCILVVSDCVDSKSTCSLNELTRLAEDSSVTVYTIGITRNEPSLAKAFETFSALSDSSPGGYAFTLDSYPSSAGSEAALKISDNEKNCIVVSTDLTDLTEELEGTLHISLKDRDASLPGVHLDPTASAPETCEHEWNDDATCQHPRTCAKCGEEDPDGELKAHEDDGSGHCKWCGEPLSSTVKTLDWIKQNMIAVIMGGVLLVLLIALLVVFLSRKSKAAADAADDAEPEPAETETTPIKGKVTVELTKKTTGERFTGEIMDYSIKAGLESPLKLPGDGAISRKHMEFIWQNGILYVQDTNSTNGTWINGKKITGAVPLNHNDLIHAGESDFYVNWYSNS